MTIPDPSLKLYFPMNTWDSGSKKIANLAPMDSSSPVMSGDVNPDVSLVRDEIFGFCMKFSGTANAYIQLSPMNFDYSTGITVEAWVSYDQLISWTRIIDFGTNDTNNSDDIFFANSDLPDVLILKVFHGTIEQALKSPSNTLVTGQWFHLATTIDQQGNAYLYKNGVQIASGTVALPNSVARATNYIGKSNWSTNANFAGKMAHLRVYNRALGQDEILGDMQADMLTYVLSNTSPSAPFRLSHPLFFSLYDNDGHYALYIDDASSSGSDYLNVEIRNVSAQSIHFIPINGPVSAKNYHFELRFRWQTLSDATVTYFSNLQTIGDWQVLAVKQDSGQVSFYLLSTKDLTLMPATLLMIALPSMSAAASIGSRGTQVEMLPNRQQMQYTNGTGISGSQLAHLQIISHQGLRNIPLQVGFVGSNRVLNDGATSTDLILEIRNLLTSNDRGGGVITLNPNTNFIIQFITSPNDAKENDVEYVPEALGTESQVKNIHVYLIDPKHPQTDWPIKLVETGSDPQWELTSTTINPSITSLAPGGALRLRIKGIVSSMDSGLTNLYLRYENIPGYWDGQFICQIEKAPLVFAPGLIEIKAAVNMELTSENKEFVISDKSRYLLHVTKNGVGIDVSNPSIDLAIGKPGTGLHYKEKVQQLAFLSNNTEVINMNESGIEVKGTLECQTLKIGNTEINSDDLSLLKKFVTNQLEVLIRTESDLVIANNNGTIEFRSDQTMDMNSRMQLIMATQP